MARLWSSGFELNSTTSNVEVDLVSGTIITSSVRSGTYAAEASIAGGNANFNYTFASADTTQGIFVRAYIRITTLPSAQVQIIRFRDAGITTQGSIRLNTTGALELWNDEDSVRVGSASSALSTNIWYRIEMKADTTTLASTALEGLIDGASFASGTVNWANGFTAVLLAANTVTTTYRWDDIAINNDTGTFQNSWPGEGKIIHLKPNAAGDNSAWTNDYLNVDEVTPNDATDLVSSNTLDQIDDHNIEAPPLADSATVNLVQVGVRFNGVGGSANASFVLRIKASASGTVEESSAITPSNATWVTNAAASPRNYSLTLYDLPGGSTTAWTKADLTAAQIGYRLSATNTNAAQVSTVWLLVDYIPVIEAMNLIQNSSITAGTSYTTASATFTANRLYIATVHSRRSDSVQPVAPTLTTTGLTWVQMNTGDYDASGTSRRTASTFRAMPTSNTTATTLIDFGAESQISSVWVIDEFTGMDTTGTNGSGAIVQSGTPVINDGVQTTTNTVTLAAFSSADNATYGAYAASGIRTTTVGTGFTLKGTVSSSDSFGQVDTEFQDGNDTSIDITWSTSCQNIGFAYEIKKAVAGGNVQRYLSMMGIG